MKFKNIPQIPSSNLLGHVRSYQKDPLCFLEEHHNNFASTFAFRLAHRTLISTNDIDFVLFTLQKKHRSFRKNLAYRKLKVLLGDGLFTSEGDDWLLHRRLAQPVFTKDKINSYQEHIRCIVKEHFNRLIKKPTFVLQREATEITLTIINQVILGLHSSGSAEVEKHLPPAMQILINRITSPINSPLWMPLKTNKKFHWHVSELEKLIEKLLNQQNNQSSLLLDLFNQLKNEKLHNVDRYLRDEVMTFFLAGHETTAVAFCWCIYTLNKYPEWKARLIEEKENKELLYAFIKEVMRLYPPVWVLGREALEDFDFHNYEVRSKQSIIFSPYLLHRDDRYWSSPLKFDPERFVNQKDPKAYIPFGIGPRMCIGNHFALMELSIMLEEWLLHFPNFKIKEQQHPGYDLSLTLRPKKEINIML